VSFAAVFRGAFDDPKAFLRVRRVLAAPNVQAAFSREEALIAHTRSNAAFLFQENKIGHADNGRGQSGLRSKKH
jgi:hypothetical protein